MYANPRTLVVFTQWVHHKLARSKRRGFSPGHMPFALSQSQYWYFFSSQSSYGTLSNQQAGYFYFCHDGLFLTRGYFVTTIFGTVFVRVCDESSFHQRWVGYPRLPCTLLNIRVTLHVWSRKLGYIRFGLQVKYHSLFRKKLHTSRWLGHWKLGKIDIRNDFGELDHVWSWTKMKYHAWCRLGRTLTWTCLVLMKG